MKILHVIPGLSSLLGGPSEVCINSVRQLRSLGVDAEIITTNYKLPQITDLDSGELVDYQGVPVRFFSHSKLHYHEYIPSTSLKKWLYNNIRNYSLLDLHYLFTHSTTVASKIAFKNKVPYTLRLMGQLEPWCLSNNQLIIIHPTDA